MDRLKEQLQRLRAEAPAGQVLTLVLAFAQCRDWPAVAALLQDIESELELPAPALSVSARDGYQLWFPLAEAIPVADGARFLSLLVRRFVADQPRARLASCPPVAGMVVLESLPAVPALDEGSGRWSAFVDPAMGGMFADAPGLEISPNPERQADLLASVRAIKPAELARCRGTVSEAPPEERPEETCVRVTLGDFQDPRDFLRAVMNDTGVPLTLRIDAAKALLANGVEGGK